MATSKSFGKTWWGNAWVEAMERIDFNTNRLPRGRRYANNGSVKAIEIKGSQVIAHVQGSRPKPYNIEIGIKGFNRSQAKQIKEIISSNPAIASELGLGRLPDALLSILDRQNIHILPQNWNDISTECSCPDWANPCKHLAAVYYILANEIDKNPFLIFNLRDISTELLTESAGIQNREDRIQKKDIFVPFGRIKTSELITQNSEPSSELLDLSFPPFGIESIFSLLPDNPLFYNSGDFKRILLHGYKSIIKGVESIHIDEGPGLSFKDIDLYLIYKDDGARFFITPSDALPKDIGGGKPLLPGFRKGEVSYKIPLISEDKLILKRVKGREFLPSIIFNIFLGLPLDTTLENNSPSSRFLNAATSIALAFVRATSFIPEVVMHGEDEFSIRYVPIIHNDKNQSAIDYLKSIMPATICFREEDNSLMIRDGVYDLLSLIITSLVHHFINPHLPSKGGISGMYEGILGRDKLCNTFFQGISYKAERFEERETARSVSNWLERLSVRKKDISPIIKIETVRDDRFAISIDVENKRDPMSPVIPLSKVFASKDEIFPYPLDLIRTDVSRQISIATEYMPRLRDVLNSKGRKKLLSPRSRWLIL